MNPLQVLKDRLQYEFTKTHTSKDYVEALGDGLYACSLSEAALNVLIFNWSVDPLGTEKLSFEDKEYQRGVEFVEEQWHRITGMF
jgi:hypothetical protein